MPLLDVTFGSQKVNPKKERGNPVVKKVFRTLPTNTLNMIDRIYDEAIEGSIQTNGKLTWTKSGALFGFSSPQPKTDVDRLWDRIISCVGDGKECLMAVGAILRIKIAERPEDWLVFKRDTGSNDPLTGKPVYVSEYWINRV